MGVLGYSSSSHPFSDDFPYFININQPSILPSGYLTVRHGNSPCLRTVHHLFLWAIEKPWLC